jgi:ribonuclease D
MSIEKLPDPELVKKPDQLQKLANTLCQEPIIAVDTESNSLYAYQEQVCLIQFSTPEKDYLVDPLALEDLTPLAPIFADPKIEKVFHAAEYDVICLKRDFDFEFENLFDTMLAARILGWEAVGLGSILEKEFDVHLEKRYQRANWGQRPLPSHLLSYARLDTHYLIPLQNLLRKELQRKKRWELAREDFDRLSEITVPNGRQLDDKSLLCWRISGSYDLEPQQAAVLLELCKYREQAAQSLDRPVFKVINDRTLLEIAQELPDNPYELGKIKGMSRGQVQRHGQAILDAVRRGLKARPAYPPRSPRPDEDFLDRVDALKRWRKQTAQDLGVKSDVVLPRDLLYTLAESNPNRREELGQVLDEVPWRFERFGEQILRVLKRK